MKQIFLIVTFAVSLGILPAVAFAQLSSTNYQVDVQYVGEEGGGYATSTSYQLGGSEGTPYEYADTPDATTTPATGGGSTGSRVPAEPGTSTSPTTSQGGRRTGCRSGQQGERLRQRAGTHHIMCRTPLRGNEKRDLKSRALQTSPWSAPRTCTARG